MDSITTPFSTGRCECYKDHNSSSGRCNSRPGTVEMPDGRGFCERCALECAPKQEAK